MSTCDSIGVLKALRLMSMHYFRAELKLGHFNTVVHSMECLSMDGKLGSNLGM
ncbi:hypothetical protein BDV26DRAFT_35104 [Aspergillus bertholletiae]|uniref:Uncharacterized protein n=1 Tax=Aspergillus bertholletiae TaxID=1226010 RepID=A0A5N7B003_9EURO|nr:hypothetical protein BDV26DRAFT_35104 [Aspergillus bertholletiae]